MATISYQEQESSSDKNQESSDKKLLSSYLRLSFSLFLISLPKSSLSILSKNQNLNFKLHQAEEQLKMMKSRRKEDSKANARVEEIFASHRNSWQLEEKRLIHQIESRDEEFGRLRAKLEELENTVDDLKKEVSERDEMISFMSRKTEFGPDYDDYDGDEFCVDDSRFGKIRVSEEEVDECLMDGDFAKISGEIANQYGRYNDAGFNSDDLFIPPKKASLKPLHWVKVTRAMQGSLWADPQKQENQSRAPEIDISELESLFSATIAPVGNGTDKAGGRRGHNINKLEKVQLVDLRRAYNCKIMLTKIKIPLPDMINAILAMDSSTLDADQVENLIRFCPTKDEMELLKNYTGSKDMVGKCEQFFLELMKVPRVESKLRVFSFRLTFPSQVKDLRCNLSIIIDATKEVKESAKLRQIMQTILTLGNALNQGTARGSAIGFKLDSLLKLSDTRAKNNKMTLMHYLCKLLAEKLPDLLDFDKNLVHLEAASKIQLKTLAEEMQAVSKGLEKVEQELASSENDGDISAGFQKIDAGVLRSFLHSAEAEVRSLISLYSEVGRNADSLSQYFGEDPARCPFEQVTQILFVFVKMFNKSRDENVKQAEAEKKKLEKEETIKERAAANASARKENADTEQSFQHYILNRKRAL